MSSSGGTTLAQIAPVAVAGAPITLNTAQLASVPNLQTVSVANLGAAGVQVQGVPVTITSVAGKLLQSLRSIYVIFTNQLLFFFANRYV